MKNNDLENPIQENNAPIRKFSASYTHYIFLLCNFISMLGLAISLIFTYKNNPDFDYKLPVIICNVISLTILAVFLYLESRIIIPYRFHINHKWYGWFIASALMFSLMLVISTIIVCLPVEWSKFWSIGLFAGCMAFSLITIGIYKYARFHIDKEIYLRKNGIQIQKEEKSKLNNQQEQKQIDNMPDKEFKKMHDKIDNSSSNNNIGKKATSNLIDELDEYEEPKKEF